MVIPFQLSAIHNFSYFLSLAQAMVISNVDYNVPNSRSRSNEPRQIQLEQATTSVPTNTRPQQQTTRYISVRLFYKLLKLFILFK